MKTYGGRGLDTGIQATETSDGGYVVVGFTSSFGAGSEDVWLLKTDYQGEMELNFNLNNYSKISLITAIE